jgi:hypothetical protein
MIEGSGFGAVYGSGFGAGYGSRSRRSKKYGSEGSGCECGSRSATLLKTKLWRQVDERICQQLISQMSRRFLHLRKNWIAWSLDLPLCSCTRRPGIINPHPCPLSIFCIRYGAHRKFALRVSCVLISFVNSNGSHLAEKKSHELSKFLLLEKNIIYLPLNNNLPGCMELMRFTRKLMILEDISGGRIKAEAKFMNVQFRWGFWAYSWEFSDLRFPYTMFTLQTSIKPLLLKVGWGGE